MHLRKDKLFSSASRQTVFLVLFVPCILIVLWLSNPSLGFFPERRSTSKWSSQRMEEMTDRRNRTMGLASRVKRTPDGSGLEPLAYRELEERVKALKSQCKRDRFRWEKKYGSVVMGPRIDRRRFNVVDPVDVSRKRNIAMARTYEGESCWIIVWERERRS